MGVCFVIGGAGTIFLYSQLKKMNETKVKRFLLMIVICLVLMSIALTGPTIKGIVDKEGWAGMTKISFNC
jgi:predicted ABC-type exoprotein transport system permease subunit